MLELRQLASITGDATGFLAQGNYADLCAHLWDEARRIQDALNRGVFESPEIEQHTVFLAKLTLRALEDASLWVHRKLSILREPDQVASMWNTMRVRVDRHDHNADDLLNDAIHRVQVFRDWEPEPRRIRYDDITQTYVTPWEPPEPNLPFIGTSWTRRIEAT